MADLNEKGPGEWSRDPMSGLKHIFGFEEEHRETIASGDFTVLFTENGKFVAKIFDNDERAVSAVAATPAAALREAVENYIARREND